MFSIIVKENLIFIKDSQILVYDSIEEYLDDYKWQIKRLNYIENVRQKVYERMITERKRIASAES